MADLRRRSRRRGSGRASSGETSSPASSSTSPYQPSSPRRFASSVSWSVSSTTSARARAAARAISRHGPGAVRVRRVEVDHAGEVVHSHNFIAARGFARHAVARARAPGTRVQCLSGVGCGRLDRGELLRLRPELGRRGHAAFIVVTAQPGEHNAIAVEQRPRGVLVDGQRARRSRARAVPRTPAAGASAAAASTASTSRSATATTRSPRASAGPLTAGPETTRSGPAAPSRRSPADRARTSSTRPHPRARR